MRRWVGSQDRDSSRPMHRRADSQDRDSGADNQDRDSRAYRHDRDSRADSQPSDSDWVASTPAGVDCLTESSSSRLTYPGKMSDRVAPNSLSGVGVGAQRSRRTHQVEDIVPVVLRRPSQGCKSTPAGADCADISFPRTDKRSSTMTDELLRIKGKKALMDFKIKIKDTVLPCHKLVCALHSPYIEKMLTSGMAEAAKQEITLDHIGVDIMKILLAYMYVEDVVIARAQLMPVIEAAHFLQMAEMERMCIAQAPLLLEPANVTAWWKMAARIDSDNIKAQCEELMASCFEDVSRSSEFLSLSYAELQDFISSICSKNVEQDHVLDAVMRWISHATGSRITHLADLISTVQLDKCSAPGIKAVIKTHEAILDQQPIMYKALISAM